MDRNAINDTVLANNAAVAAQDLDAILATFETDGVLVSAPDKLAQGMPALRSAFEQFVALAPRITVSSHDIVQSGDLALHSSAWTMTAQAPDGSSFEQSGLSTVVLRKQDDGRWLMVIDNPFADQLLRTK